MSDWYVVFTHPAAEAKAILNLERQGFRTYMPRFRTLRRHARREEPVWRPLFPRYLFISFDSVVARWRAILSTFGVADLIRHGDRPTRVPEGIIDGLRAREVGGEFEPSPAQARLKPGTLVQVQGGPFHEWVGRLESLTDGDRVRVLLSLLGREVRTELAISKVQAV